MSDEIIEIIEVSETIEIIESVVINNFSGEVGTDSKKIVKPVGETVSGQRVVSLVNGQIVMTDINNLEHAYNIIGISLQTVEVGNIEVGVNGYELQYSGWSFDITKPVFCGLNSHPTDVPPTQTNSLFICQVGFPVTANTLRIDIKPITRWQ